MHETINQLKDEEKAKQSAFEQTRHMDEDAEFEDVTLLLVRIKEALTDAEYKLFSQYFLEGKDQAVLAPEYHISQVSVSRRIRKIKEKLQRALFEEYKEVI